MSRTNAIVLLAAAALLESIGDAVIRTAVGRQSGPARFGLFLLGAIVLFAYGCLVNAPPWRFGELLGLYIVFFFLFAQISAWLVFHQTPTPPLLIGGMLIFLGGAVIVLGACR